MMVKSQGRIPYIENFLYGQEKLVGAVVWIFFHNTIMPPEYALAKQTVWHCDSQVVAICTVLAA